MSEKISDLSDIADGDIAGNDEFIVVDPNDTTTGPAGPGGSDKIMTLTQLLAQSSAFLRPTGTTAGDEAAIAADVTTASANTYGGTVECAAGTWNLSAAGLAAIARSGITLRFQPNSCVVGSGSGTLIRMYDDSTYGSRVAQGGGVLGNPVFDGSAMTGTSKFLHISDIFKARVEMDPQNLTTGSSIAAHYDLNMAFMERGYGRFNVTNCVNGVVFDVNLTAGTVTGSFYRGDYEIYIDQQNAAWNGVVWQNGAFMVGGRFIKTGNYTGSSSLVTPGSALTFTGQTPGGALSPSYSGIFNSEFSADCECGGSTYNPTTINFGSGNNLIDTCFGRMNWNAGFADSNCVNNVNAFNGYVDGDPTIPSWIEQGQTNSWLGAVQTITGTSPAAVTAMFAPLYAYTTMEVNFIVPYTSSVTSGTPKFAFTGGGSQVKTRLVYEWWSGTTLVDTVETGDYTATVTGPTLTSASNLTLKIYGSVLNSAAATMQLNAWEGTSGDGFDIDYAAIAKYKPLSN